MDIRTMTKEQLSERLAVLKEEYNSFKALNLKLDMSRGKPSSDQLELSNAMLSPELLGNFGIAHVRPSAPEEG